MTRNFPTVGLFVVLSFGVSSAQVSSHAPTVKAPPAHGAMGQNPHGTMPSSRVRFAKECGITNPTMSQAVVLTRSKSGQWSRVTKTTPPSPTDSALVRAWHEKTWVVEFQEADESGDAIHIAEMCFNAKGSITRILDRYINMPKCGCMRVISATYDAAGKSVKREQTFYKGDSSQKIAAPASSGTLPAPMEYRNLEQLPFYESLKGMH